MTRRTDRLLLAPGTRVRSLPVTSPDGGAVEPADGLVLDYDLEHSPGSFPVEFVASGVRRLFRACDLEVVSPPGGSANAMHPPADTALGDGAAPHD